MKTIPFWTDGLRRPDNLIASPLPSKVNVAIVGGGYTGLAAARKLLQHGASIAILERETIGWGASSRNGGLMTTGMKAPTRVMMKRYGNDLAKTFWQASVAAVDLVEQIVSEDAIDCDFKRTGHLALAVKPAHFEAMKESRAWYSAELGYEMRLVPPGELESEIGSQAYNGGLVDENSAGIDPAKYVLGLGASVARGGGFLCEGTAVTGIKRFSRGFQVETNNGSIEAEQVLVATNGYTDSLIPELKPRIFPVGSYIIITEPLPAELRQAVSPKDRMFYDTRHFLNYFRLTTDGRMLFGGRNNLSPSLDLTDSARRLYRRLLEVFPQLDGIPISHSWTGRLGLTFDLMPHIGQIDGIYYALGYSGHGVTISTFVGTEVGRLLSGEKSQSPFMAISHPTRIFYRSRPWFLPLAAAYYRLLDRFA